MSGQLKFEATIDDKDFNNKLNGMKKGVDGLESQAVRMTEKQQKAYERLANTIKSNQESLKNATDPTQIALYNQRIKEATASMQKLVATASKPIPVPNNGRVMPYNSQGNSIGQMQDALGSFKDRLVGEKDINNVRQLNANIQQLEGNIKRTTNIGKKGFDEMGNAIPTQKASNFGRLFSNIFASFGIFAGISTAISLIKSFYDTTKQLQTLNKAMELGAKDSEAFRSNLSFLKDITEQYGLELISTSEAYNKFYIAAKNKLALDDIQLIFEKISKSASIMGLSVADQAGIFRALEQMMSKGTVQAEELRGQLGDRLPGAFEIMARSMGISTTELGKMMQNGEVLASDVLPKFAIELEKTFGADKVTMIDNLTASENRLKNEWTEFVEEINGSDNAIGNFVTGFLGGVSSMIAGITRLSSAWSRLWGKTNEQNFNEGYESAMVNYTDYDKFESQRKKALKDRQEFMREERELNKQISELTKEYEEKSNKSILGKAFTFGKSVNALGSEIEDLNKKLGDTRGRIKAIDDLEAELKNPVTETKVVEETEKQRKERERAEKEALKDAEDLGKKRIAFVLELQKAESNLSQSTLTGLDLELAKVTETYNERIKKAKELKANQDAINRIEALKTKETEIVTFKAETEGIKAGLETLRKDYEDFENAKKQIGIQKATELYKEQLDISKTYQQSLADEINNLSGRDLNDLEKARLAELMKLYADYNIQKQNDDRKRLEELYTMTADFEQKLFVLKQDYEKKKAELEATTSGEDLASRLAILEKDYREKAGELISTFADEKGFGTAITQGFIGATKQIITAQIQSLRTYLKNAKDLTKVQINEIEKLISNLDDKLYNATDSGEGGALRGVNVQINGLKKSLSDLEGRKKFLESLGLPETKTELAEIEATIAGILVQLDSLAGAKARAIGAEFTKISDIFSDLASSFEDIGGSSNNVFKNLSKIAGLSSKISNTFGAIKDFQEAQKSEEGASFTQGLGAFTGIFSSVMGVFSMIKGVFDEMEKAEDRAAQIRIDSYIKSLEFERELARLETERIRRNALNLSDKGRELDSVDNEILLKQRQLAEIQDKLNTFSSYYLSTEERAFFKNLVDNQTDIQKLYDDLKKLKEAGVEFTKEQAEQFDILEKFWLGNRSWEELQQVLNNLTGDYIRDDMRAYVEQAIKLGKELEEAGYTLEDIQNMIREMATGTSIEQLSDSLADAFRNGEDAVYSFGQTIEEVLKNAIITAFKNEFIVKEMKPLFDLMGDLGADGQYTQEELDELREKARQIAETLQMQWDAINGSLDIDFGNTDDFGASAKDGIKRITETQADRLTGILTGVQVDVIASRQILFESKNLLSSSLDNLVKIESNTARTYQALERIESNLQNNQAQALGMP